MDIKRYGGSAIQINAGKGSVMLVDPANPLSSVPKAVAEGSQVVLATQYSHVNEGTHGSAYAIHSPGEYEVAGFIIQGFATELFAPDQEDDKGVYYRITSPSGVDIGLVGAAAESSLDAIAQNLAAVDVLFVGVGGGGYCFDAQFAAKLVKNIEPNLVVPFMYSSEQSDKLGLGLAKVNDFLSAMGRDSSEDLFKASLKINDRPASGAVIGVTCLEEQA